MTVVVDLTQEVADPHGQVALAVRCTFHNCRGLRGLGPEQSLGRMDILEHLRLDASL